MAPRPEPDAPAADRDRGKRRRGLVELALRWPHACLALAGALLLLPTLIGPDAFSESANFNLVWATQFRERWAAGEFHPRWLPGGFDGLGSPAFFFYAPAPFFLIGALDLLTGGGLATGRILALVWMLLLVASGVSMRLWLARMVARRDLALFGAIAYMAAPYHLFDHYVRGAIGEFAAYAALPLVALGIVSLGRGGIAAGLMVSLSFAALVLSHLPATLIIAASCIPVLLGVTAARLGTKGAALRFLPRALGAGILALMLSATYWLPALALQGHIAAENLRLGHFQATNWLILTPSRWPDGTIMAFVAPLATAYSWLASWLFLGGLRAGARGREVGAFAGTSLLVLSAVFGLFPFLWEEASLLSRIQFPWRMLLAVEFLLVTAFVMGVDRGLVRRPLRMPLIAVVIMAPALGLLLGLAVRHAVIARGESWRDARALLLARMPDALEYLPRGFPLGYRTPTSRFVEDVLGLTGPIAARPLAWPAIEDAAEVVAEPVGPQRIEIRTRAKEPAVIVLRRFHFPAWRLEVPSGDPAPRLEPYGPYRLMSFTAPPGTTRFVLVRSDPPAVRLGRGLTLAGVAIAAALALVLALRAARRG